MPKALPQHQHQHQHQGLDLHLGLDLQLVSLPDTMVLASFPEFCIANNERGYTALHAPIDLLYSATVMFMRKSMHKNGNLLENK